MSAPHTPPTFGQSPYNCPICRAYAKQDWKQASFNPNLDPRLYRTICNSCHECTYWLDKKMVYPDTGSFPSPNIDLGEEIISDYLEAAGISTKSPRGAAALLRLSIQKLCKKLGEDGENINSDIGSLVKKGLNPKVQQMLDYVRVVGNEAVHPGQMDLKDNPEIVVVLARLLNEIASEMITKPREIQELYSSLPQEKLKGIEDRDKKK